MRGRLVGQWRRRQPTIHFYALCWNDARVLPFFFRHYDPIVDQYFITDHGSDDGSIELLQQHPKVTLAHLPRTSESFLDLATHHYNQIWKSSRGVADWVIVANIDEHLHHRTGLREHLRACTRRRITLVVPEGFQMVAEEFPDASVPLWQSEPFGVRAERCDKPEIFDPNSIDEINFAPGRHEADPAGVVRAETGEVQLLHYKYLGATYIASRQAELHGAIPKVDTDRGLGTHYVTDPAVSRARFDDLRSRATKVVR